MKGVSTLIAAVLLMATTLVISLIVTTSFTTLTKSQASTIQARTSDAINCTSSSLSIESVYLDTGTQTSRVIIRNSGQIRETIVRASMFNSTGSMAAPTDTYPISIAKGALASLAFNITSNMTCTNFNRIVVTTQCTIETFDRTPNNC